MSWPSPVNRRSSGGAWAGRGTHNSDRAISSLLSIANMLSRLRGSIAPDIAAQRGGGPGLRRLIRAPPRGDLAFCEEHARRTEELFPKLWLPGGWAGVYGAYQSELKAIMAMIGQPGGTVRRPRLALTDPSALAEIRHVLVEAGIAVVS